MNAIQVPPPPERPDVGEKPRGSWLGIALAIFAGLAITIVLTFLTLGFFGPFVVLSVVIFGVIGLQYLVWGWWFERIYRSGTPHDGDDP